MLVPQIIPSLTSLIACISRSGTMMVTFTRNREISELLKQRREQAQCYKVVVCGVQWLQGDCTGCTDGAVTMPGSSTPSLPPTPPPHLRENLNIHSMDVSPPSADSRSGGLAEGSWLDRS
jgi:hypothetical protein